MSEQVMISLDLLEEIADSLDYEVRDVRDKVRAVLQSTAPSQPVPAQPAGEVPKNDETGLEEWVAGKFGVGGAFRGELCGNTDWALARLVWSAALESQHTRIVAELQERAVVMPELGDTETGEWGDAYRRGWNAYAREYARLNGKGGV